MIPFGGPAAAPGVVYLVGAGPGDPGLIGLRAARLLETATFVAYDRLAPPEALSLCSPACERRYVGKLPDRHALAQGQLNALLVERARHGDAVVRLKGGDPFVLGRGSEEAAACTAAGVPFEVVPAVTAGTAAAAYAGIPVTHRGVAPGFAVVTGHEDPTKPQTQTDYRALAAFPGTLLLYMGLAFETPLLMFFLTKLRIINPAQLARYRKYVLILSFIIGAMITPTPDPMNQTLVSLPIYLLFELGLLLSRLA